MSSGMYLAMEITKTKQTSASELRQQIVLNIDWVVFTFCEFLRCSA